MNRTDPITSQNNNRDDPITLHTYFIINMNRGDQITLENYIRKLVVIEVSK